MRRSSTATFRFVAALLWIAGAFAGPAEAASAKLLLVGVEVDDSAANNDGWLEPGETVNLKVELYNDGDLAATSISGQLSYQGTNPALTILDPTATWPDLPAKGAPALTDPPHFQVQVGSALACGAVLPFRLTATTASGDTFTHTVQIKVGQRIDVDMLEDPIRRFNEPEAKFWGTDANDQLGRAAAMGDINGDGYADILISSRGAWPNFKIDSGQVYLVYGKAAQWLDQSLGAPNFAVARFFGADAGDALGSWPQSLATGDINGDGCDDIIVGALGADSLGNSRDSAGEVYVIYGKAVFWTDTDLAAPPAGSAIARFWGTDAGDLLGAGVGSGDINNDGFDDLILGAPWAASVGNARAEAGEVYLVYGKAALWTDTDLAAPPPGVTRIWGADAGDRLGWAGTALDINGDTFADVAVGAPYADSLANSRIDAGEVDLIYGQPAPLADIDLAAPPVGVARFWGAEVAQSHENFGSALAAGDVNGDGVEDLIVGAPYSDLYGDSAATMRMHAGQVYLLYGKSVPWTDTDMITPPPTVARFWGAQWADAAGWSVSSGDLNGDGYADIIIGTPQNGSPAAGALFYGRVYVVYGKASRWIDTDLFDPPSGVFAFLGDAAQELFGQPVAAGDVNADGYDDLILPAQYADGPVGFLTNSGDAHLWYGKPTDTYLAGTTHYLFVDAATKAGTKLALNCDNCSVAVPIGFKFPFYAEEFTTVYVSSDGVISFEPMPKVWPAPACMPARGGADLLVAPFWDDLNPAAGPFGSGVYTQLQGVAPNRRLTIEWKDVPHAPNVGAATFEVTLYESSGQILVQYQDLDFGNPAYNNGASAVAGVENRTGVHGVVWSCSKTNILAAGTAVRFGPTTPLVENGSEYGSGLFTATGLWHNSTSSCEPDQQEGVRSWYFGNAATCHYGDNTSGVLRIPSVPDFPADGRLAFWSRESAQVGVDLAGLQLSTSGTGGPYSILKNVSDNLNAWKYAGTTSLAGHGGDTVDLQFAFGADGAVNSLGWMVDQIQLTGCNAAGPSLSGISLAFPLTPLCQGAIGRVDSAGSFCSDLEMPLGYQWFENGVMIAGATRDVYEIPPTHPAGAYDYAVAIDCGTRTPVMSDPARVDIAPPPGAVGESLELMAMSGGRDLTFTWADTSSADDYVVLQDRLPNGSFLMETGTAPDGRTGLTVPMPPDDIVYFLVAGRNAACGAGPLE